MIIDSHIHLFPEAASEEPRHWAETREERVWLSCVLPKKGPQLQGWATVDQLLKDMDAAGVSKSVILGWYWENPDTCEEQNRWIAEKIASHKDRLYQMVSFNANGGSKSLDALDRAFDNGALGIGELNPPAQGFRYDDPSLADALDKVSSRGLCANFHVTEPAGHTYPGKTETPFCELQAMANRHPHTQFVFAHLGGLLPFYEFNSMAKRDLSNVVYDTAAIPLIYSKKIYKAVCSAIGSDRVLFGSDYPLRTFPRKQVSPSFTHHLDQMRDSGLSEHELRQILSANASRLFKLE